MDLIADRGRRVTVEELNTTKLLAHARQQADAAQIRRHDDRRLSTRIITRTRTSARFSRSWRTTFCDSSPWRAAPRPAARHACPAQIGYPGHGRPRHALSAAHSEKTEPAGCATCSSASAGWTPWASTIPACSRPACSTSACIRRRKWRVELCWAYNRWLTEKVLPEARRPHLFACCACRSPIRMRRLRQVETFGAPQGRHRLHGHDRAQRCRCTTTRYMKVYRAIEERGLALAFHSGPNWGEPVFQSCNRFISVHALGFTFYNILHLHQLGHQRHGRALPQAAGDLDRGRPRLGPVPDAAPRPRIHAAPVGMPAAEEEAVATTCATCIYSSQPMEIQDMEALEMHLPHDQCGNAAALRRPTIRTGTSTCRARSTICRSCPRRRKHNILGGTAARLFKLPPRNEKQKANLIKFGNLAA